MYRFLPLVEMTAFKIDALGMAADTGPAPKALWRMSVQPGPLLPAGTPLFSGQFAVTFRFIKPLPSLPQGRDRTWPHSLFHIGYTFYILCIIFA
jgi:hypothetical protein